MLLAGFSSIHPAPITAACDSVGGSCEPSDAPRPPAEAASLVGDCPDHVDSSQELSEGISPSRGAFDDDLCTPLDRIDWGFGLEEPQLKNLLHPFSDSASFWELEDIESLLT